MIRTLLKDGINFSFEKSDKFKTSMLVLNFSLPLNDKNASTYSLLCEVMKRGCNKYPTLKEMSSILTDLYSSFGCYVFKKGESLCFGIYNSFIDDKFIPEDVNILKMNINFIKDFILDPYILDGEFCSDYIEQERINLINRIKEKINDKGTFAVSRCLELMCEGENYSVSSSGSVETVENLTNSDLISAYNYLIFNAKLDIYYFGSSDFNTVKNEINPLLMKIPNRDSSEYPINIHLKSVDNPRIINENINAIQGNLVLGFRTNITLADDEYPALVLYNEILGNSPISKLFMNIREKHSLCYFCNSNIDSLKGIMLICCGIDNENNQIAIDAILKEVDSMSKGNITENEIINAKSSLINSYKEINDSPFSLINWFYGRHILGVSKTPDSFSDEISNVTLDDIINVSKKIDLDLIYFLKGIIDE